jgi:hypothetical protein
MVVKKYRGATPFAIRDRVGGNLTDIQRSLNSLVAQGLMVKLEDGSYAPTSEGRLVCELEKKLEIP